MTVRTGGTHLEAAESVSHMVVEEAETVGKLGADGTVD